MVSNRWQKNNDHVLNLAVVFIGGIPFGILQTPRPVATQLLLIVGLYLISFFAIRWLNQRVKKTFVRVYACEYETAVSLVQRVLRKQHIHYSKQLHHQKTTFNIRTGDMRLDVENFPLNMMVDDHLDTEEATKLSLRHESKENTKQMKEVRLMLDEAFATL